MSVGIEALAELSKGLPEMAAAKDSSRKTPQYRLKARNSSSGRQLGSNVLVSGWPVRQLSEISDLHIRFHKPTCHGCHTLVKSRDFVFTKYQKR
jgi:hypothetical protein